MIIVNFSRMFGGNFIFSPDVFSHLIFESQQISYNQKHSPHLYPEEHPKALLYLQGLNDESQQQVGISQSVMI